jgi:D-alanyl-D-alanine-carboxypeptidase/D-alanyl-D-alanine-endopeptidase
MRAPILSIIAAISLGGTAMAQTPAFPDDAALLDILKSRVEDGRATGLVLGVMEADGSTRVVAYGDPGNGAQPLGPDTVFEIGSVTKVFTTTVLADWALKGKVSLDRPAQDYAPPGMTLPTRDGKAITLGHLAEQNSGLPRLPGNLDLSKVDLTNPYAAYTTAMLNDFLGSYTLPRDPGAAFEYSNLGMGLLGNLLAHSSGQSYEDMVRTGILAPLGMTSTGITLTPEMQARLAKGHDAAGKPAANWDLPSLAGAGALRSTMTDMLKFLDANTGEPKNELERAMRHAHQPRFPIGGAAKIGLGWITITTAKGSFIYHDGGTGGYGAIVAIDPQRNVGLVLLGNRTGIPEDIAMHLMDASIPLTPPPSGERAEVAVPADVLASYAGVYALDAMPAFKLTVTLEGGQLQMQATGQDKFPIFPESQVKFFLKVVDAQVTFVPAASGQAAHLILHQGGANQKATKE